MTIPELDQEALPDFSDLIVLECGEYQNEHGIVSVTLGKHNEKIVSLRLPDGTDGIRLVFSGSDLIFGSIRLPDARFFFNSRIPSHQDQIFLTQFPQFRPMFQTLTPKNVELKVPALSDPTDFLLAHQSQETRFGVSISLEVDGMTVVDPYYKRP